MGSGRPQDGAAVVERVEDRDLAPGVKVRTTGGVLRLSDVLRFRPATPADMALVVDSWVESYRSSHAAGLVPNCMQTGHEAKCLCFWNAVMRPSVTWVLERPKAKVVVAYHPEAEVGCDLYGWVATEYGVLTPVRVFDQQTLKWVEKLEPSPLPLIHYVYVKDQYRKQKIAARLLRAAGIDVTNPFMVTCKTGVSTEIISKHALQSRWMPLLARHKP